MIAAEIAPQSLALSLPEPEKKKWRPGKYTPKPVVQILEIQAIVLARIRNPNLKAVSLAALARAWIELEDRKRILRGIPLPETAVRIDPAKWAKQLRSRSAGNRAEPTNAFIEQEPSKSISGDIIH